MGHEFKVDSPIVIDRILSRNLEKCSEQLRNEILPDTTPVPFFGDFENATIVSVGINPSSEEFPKIGNDRRLSHLSDLDLPRDYYQKGLSSMSNTQAQSISKSLLTYFETNPYRDWFDLAEIAINGSGATYFKNKSVSNQLNIACHVDIFPWSTKQYSQLTTGIKQEFYEENLEFFVSYLKSDLVEEVVILGSTVKDIMKKCFRDNKVPAIFHPQEFQSTNSKFEVGNILLGTKKLKYSFLSKGPSARYLKPPEKQQIHFAFSDWVKNLRLSL